MPASDAQSRGEGRHWGVFACTLLHASVFGAAAFALPIRLGVGAWILALMALSHALVAGSALVRSGTWLPPAFVNLGRLSLLAFVGICAMSLHSAAYVAQLYGGLGRGIAAVIAAMLCVVALWTVPVGLWGLSWSSRSFWRSWIPKLGVGALLLAAWLGARQGHATPVSPRQGLPLASQLQAELKSYLHRAPPASQQPGIRDPGPWSCPQLDSSPQGVVVAYGWEQGKGQAKCFVAASASELAKALEKSGLRGLYRLDWVTHKDRWDPQRTPWLSPLSMRPGVDGVCMEHRCLAPWQLVALDAYLSLRPVPSIPDLRFGVSEDSLALWLGAKKGATALRISTQSYIVDERGILRLLARQRKQGKAPTLAQLHRAKKDAQSYLLAAQRKDGGFEYMRQVFLEQRLPDQLNLPRQGGTLAALCEWGDLDAGVDAAVSRALGALVKHEQGLSEGSLLWPSSFGELADMGATALPLIALLKCRDRVQGRHDALIGRLLHGLLRFQRPDGSFSPVMRLPSGAILPGNRARLYSAGQGVLALLSGLRAQPLASSSGWPDKAKLQEAAQAAMHYYGRTYWSHFLADFFFIEENWHCLAAKEGLDLLPDSDYQDFCIDYLRFKSKFTLRAHSGVDPAFLGGYGFGNIIVPQTTPSAGQAEALAAGVAILEARNQDATPLREELALILGFLWRQQLDAVNCRACVNPGLMRGGFTESMISPTIRIDYVQHVLSALGSGLGVLSGEERRAS